MNNILILYISSETPPPIPLEPVIIVKESNNKHHSKSVQNNSTEYGNKQTVNDAIILENYSEKSSESEQTSDNTFVV